MPLFGRSEITNNELALFAGIGGGILGTKLLGFRTICAVENDPFCREILLRRQTDGFLEAFPIWERVEDFDGRPWRGLVHLLSAGFPCQPWAAPGRQLGSTDSRNLWPDTIRIIREVEPVGILLENSPRLRNFQYFGRILGDLAEGGYHARWDVLPASTFGAPHARERLWILAYAKSLGLQGSISNSEMAWGGLRVRDWWDSEPQFRGMDVRDSVGLDRIRTLGNAQVPSAARAAFELLRKGQ